MVWSIRSEDTDDDAWTGQWNSRPLFEEENASVAELGGNDKYELHIQG